MPNRYNEFVARLVDLSPNDPAVDFENIFRLWLEYTGAKWALFWMGCNDTGQWNIRYAESSDKNAYWTENAAVLDDRSVAQFCVDANVSAYVDTPKWNRDFKGKHYHVSAKSEIAQLGASVFRCIPMKGTFDNSEKCAALCLHFESDSESNRLFSDDEFLVLGRLTWIQTQLSLKSKQQRILSELNELDVAYSGENLKRPARSRKLFAKGVVRLLEEEFSAKAVTLFCRNDDDHNELACISTTHDLFDLRKEEPRKVSPSEVCYKNGKGATGECFATGEFKSITVEFDKKRKPFFVEGHGNSKFFPSSTVFCPIITPISSSAQKRSEVIGVIRCVELTHQGIGEQKTFDAGEIETLQFIAAQVAPTLASFELRISRERTISIVKHDLLGPISLIRHIADDLESSAEGVDGIRTIPFRKLMNLKSFALAASHLVTQLDPTQNIMSNYSPKPVLIGGSIIARLAVVTRYLASEENSMRVVFDDFSILPELWIDKEFVERVLFNLIMNAIKYGDPNTTIYIKPRVTHERVLIEVTNTGPGVEDDHKARIFLEHFRSKQAARKKVGLGLGLFISRRAMQRHGGDLILASARNPTTFQMWFPISLRERPEK